MFWYHLVSTSLHEEIDFTRLHRLSAMFARYDAPDSDGSEDSNGCGSGEPCSGSESSSSSVRSTSGLINNMRNLTLNQVLCMETTGDGDPSQAAANGKSRERILQAMKKPCCRKRCKRLLSFKVIFTFCVGFWSLSKAGQDCLLLGILLCFVLKKYYNRENNSKTSCDFQFESKALELTGKLQTRCRWIWSL